MYHEQCPAYPCYCSTLLFGSLNSVGHGVHCPLSSCKNSLREATQCLCPATRSYLQRSALERAVLRNMCSFQFPSPRVWRPSLVAACRQEHLERPRPPPPYFPASWRLVQDHRATTYALQAEHDRQGRVRAATPFRAGKGAALAARRARSTSTNHNTAASQPPTHSISHSLTLPLNTRCHARVCFPILHSLSPFSNSNHRENLHAIREFVSEHRNMAALLRNIMR